MNRGMNKKKKEEEEEEATNEFAKKLHTHVVSCERESDEITTSVRVERERERLLTKHYSTTHEETKNVPI